MSKTKKTPINKGNYSMDTEERLARFEEYRSEGWENEYKKYRENWVTFPKAQIIKEYPLLIDIELSSICNLKCPMCYTITDKFKSCVKTGLMDMDLFHKIVDEVAGKVPAVRLSLRGEATLHPHFIECIKYCKEHGIGEVSFLSNCSNFTEDYFVKVMEAGADWITISIDGLAEQYNSVRKPLVFEDTLAKIKMMDRIKKERGVHRPVIKVQGIWPSIRENPSEYYNTFCNCTDLVAFNPLIDYLGKDTDIDYVDEFSCPQIYQRMVISSNGNVMLCANDEEEECVIGNVAGQSIYDIWHCEKIEKVRTLHKSGNFLDVSICKKCYLPRKTECNEVAYINGRELLIENYTKRSQKIGE